MTHFFLKAKHWQLFLWMVGIPMLAQVFYFIAIFQLIQDSSSDPQLNPGLQIGNLKAAVGWLLIGALIAFLGLLGWNWSIGVGLNEKLPEGTEMKTGLLRGGLIGSLAYMLLLNFFVLKTFTNLDTPEFVFSPVFFALLVLGSFALTFFLFYAYYFNAKTLKSVELQRKAELTEFAVEFLLLWFHPVGVWFIQPRVNAIQEDEGLTSRS